MLKRDDVLNQLKMLESVQRNMNPYRADIYKIAYEAVKAYKWDEREKITVEVMATKAAEGDAYYYDLETGDRLVIRNGQIEGIYSPEEKPSEWETAFKKLCKDVHCPECPARFSCSQYNGEIFLQSVCEENILEALSK